MILQSMKADVAKRKLEIEILKNLFFPSIFLNFNLKIFYFQLELKKIDGKNIFSKFSIALMERLIILYATSTLMECKISASSQTFLQVWRSQICYT